MGETGVAVRLGAPPLPLGLTGRQTLEPLALHFADGLIEDGQQSGRVFDEQVSRHHIHLHKINKTFVQKENHPSKKKVAWIESKLQGPSFHTYLMVTP